MPYFTEIRSGVFSYHVSEVASVLFFSNLLCFRSLAYSLWTPRAPHSHVKHINRCEYTCVSEQAWGLSDIISVSPHTREMFKTSNFVSRIRIPNYYLSQFYPFPPYLSVEPTKSHRHIAIQHPTSCPTKNSPKCIYGIDLQEKLPKRQANAIYSQKSAVLAHQIEQAKAMPDMYRFCEKPADGYSESCAPPFWYSRTLKMPPGDFPRKTYQRQSRPVMVVLTRNANLKWQVGDAPPFIGSLYFPFSPPLQWTVINKDGQISWTASSAHLVHRSGCKVCSLAYAIRHRQPVKVLQCWHHVITRTQIPKTILAAAFWTHDGRLRESGQNCIAVRLQPCQKISQGNFTIIDWHACSIKANEILKTGL